MDFDHYAVVCNRGEREEFTIVFANLAQGSIKRTIGPFMEAEVRAEMNEMGLSRDKIEDNIRRARQHADQTSQQTQ